MFTVVCPTFNRSRAILPTLESVKAQELTSWELWVVSDGSTDDTDDIVRDAAAGDDRIHFLRLEHAGHPSGPRNEAIRRAQGRYIAYVDHDDTWYPQHLTVLARLLSEGAEWAVTGARRVEEGGGRIDMTTGILDSLWHPEMQVQGPRFEPARSAHSIDMVDRMPLWVEHPDGYEDWELWLRWVDLGHRPVFTTEPTVHIALHPSATRRWQIQPRFAHPIRRFDSVQAAQRAHLWIGDPQHAERFRDAIVADVREWYIEMEKSGEMRWPVDTQTTDVATLIDQFRDYLPGLITIRAVVPVPDGGAALVIPLPTLDSSHAQRASELARRTLTRQLALAEELIDHMPEGA